MGGLWSYLLYLVFPSISSPAHPVKTDAAQDPYTSNSSLDLVHYPGFGASSMQR